MQGESQPPQCWLLPLVSTQVAPQSVSPPGQAHIPAWQLSPARHALLQTPQCEKSVWVSTQSVPQRV